METFIVRSDSGCHCITKLSWNASYKITRVIEYLKLKVNRIGTYTMGNIQVVNKFKCL